MFKLLCVVLPVVARVAVATPATLKARCDDPTAHPAPLTEPASNFPTADFSSDLPPIELEPIDPTELESFGTEEPWPSVSPSLPNEPSPAPEGFESPSPADFESPAPSNFESPAPEDFESPIPDDLESPAWSPHPSSPDSNPNFPGLSNTTDWDDSHSSRQGFADSSRRKNVVYFTDW